MPVARPVLLPLLLLLVPAQAAEVTVHAARSGDVLQVGASAEFEGSLMRASQVLTHFDEPGLIERYFSLTKP
ncbi:MAG: hypothetical protein ACREVR_09605 [Burkholderiales bacterium]